MKQTIIDRSGRQLAIVSKTELVCVENGSNKFWTGTVALHENPATTAEKAKPWIVILSWGRNGTVGQKQENRFTREHGAVSYVLGRERDKTRKGYSKANSSPQPNTFSDRELEKVEALPAVDTDWDLF